MYNSEESDSINSVNSYSNSCSSEGSSRNSSNSSDSEIDKYDGKDYRYKYGEKFVYSGYCILCANEKPKYINIEKYNVSNNYTEVEIEVPFKGELYNMYVDVERARYGEDITIVVMKNGKLTNLCVDTNERQIIMSYNIIDCILCEERDKIVLSIMGNQKQERRIKWAICYKKIN